MKDWRLKIMRNKKKIIAANTQFIQFDQQEKERRKKNLSTQNPQTSQLSVKWLSVCFQRSHKFNFERSKCRFRVQCHCHCYFTHIHNEKMAQFHEYSITMIRIKHPYQSEIVMGMNCEMKTTRDAKTVQLDELFMTLFR